MRARRLILVVAILAVLAAGAGSALALTGSSKGPAARTDYASCLKKAGTTAAMQACISAEIKRLSGQLASAYKKLLGTANVNTSALAAAQSRWIAFRTSDCKFAGTLNAGGSLQAIDVGTCTVDLTSARLAEIRVFQKQAKP
jgi:uncharacterized protein YecT (DUF1311 family)